MYPFQTYNTGWVFVDSSNLEAVRYDPATHHLHIRFRSDAVYVYYGVPVAIHQGLMAADSKGGYLREYIRDVYAYERLD